MDVIVDLFLSPQAAALLTLGVIQMGSIASTLHINCIKNRFCRDIRGRVLNKINKNRKQLLFLFFFYLNLKFILVVFLASVFNLVYLVTLSKFLG